MPSGTPESNRIRTIIIVVVLLAFTLVVVLQQISINALEKTRKDVNEHGSSLNTRKPSLQAETSHGELSSNKGVRRSREDLLENARQERADEVEKQLAEISAPLSGDMASTMFNAEVRKGQSIVTGGYQTSDGRNQFTILKPKVVTDRDGGKQIEIDSNLIAMSEEDTKRSGLDSLATNARNTLQHAESWQDSDVSGTMNLLRDSAESQHLGQPRTVVLPGGEFSISMTSDDQSSYTLSGTADLSPDGSGVILKARVEQKDVTK